jgi:hypothetical protein
MSDIEWQDLESWENDRIIETFISSDEIDQHGEQMSVDALIKIMPWLNKYGFYEWQHTGFPIGKFIGWRLVNGKPQVRVGIHDAAHSNIPQHDKAWMKILEWYKNHGNYGKSSIKGVKNLERHVKINGSDVNKILDMGIWGVGWVGDNAANTKADVTYINQFAKELTPDIIQKAKEVMLKPEKLDRCVREVMAQGKTEEQAFAICNAALQDDIHKHINEERVKEIVREEIKNNMEENRMEKQSEEFDACVAAGIAAGKTEEEARAACSTNLEAFKQEEVMPVTEVPEEPPIDLADMMNRLIALEAAVAELKGAPEAAPAEEVTAEKSVVVGNDGDVTEKIQKAVEDAIKPLKDKLELIGKPAVVKKAQPIPPATQELKKLNPVEIEKMFASGKRDEGLRALGLK